MIPLAHALARTLSQSRDSSYQPPAVACRQCGDTGRIISRQTCTASRCRCLPELTRQHAVTTLWEHSGLPPRPEATFERLAPDGPPETNPYLYRKAWRTATECAARPAGTLTIAGNAGSGKTTLALATAHRVLDRPQPLFWTSAGELLRSLRHQATGPSETVPRRHDTVLVIDDIPLEAGTPWEQEQLRVLIATRDDYRQPTVCVLRGDPEQAPSELTAKLARQYAGHRYVLLTAGANAPQRLPPSPMAETMTFARFSASGSLRAVKETASRWAHEPAGWLCIVGPPGTGKTHLAVAVANRRAQAGDTVHFVTSPDLMAELRAASAPGASRGTDPLQRALAADLLVLDDLGAERFTPFADEQLTRLLGHRYDHRRPTVLTTNLTSAQLRATRPRLASRIADQFVTTRLPVSGPDYRSQRPEAKSW